MCEYIHSKRSDITLADNNHCNPSLLVLPDSVLSGYTGQTAISGPVRHSDRRILLGEIGDVNNGKSGVEMIGPSTRRVGRSFRNPLVQNIRRVGVMDLPNTGKGCQTHSGVSVTESGAS